MSRTSLLSRLFRALAIGIAASTVACSSAPKTTSAPTPTSPPAMAYETFDAVWETVDTQHFDATHNGVDWKAIRARYRPKVADVRTDEDLRELLEAMIAELGQSHFGVIPGRIANPGSPVAESHVASDPAPTGTAASVAAVRDRGDGGDLGILFRLVDAKILTVAPSAGGAADRAGVRAGWELIEVDGRALGLDMPSAGELKDAEANMMLRFTAQGMAANAASTAPGESVRLAFIDERGSRREVTLVAESFGGEIVKFGNLPPLETHVTERSIATAELLSAGIDVAALKDAKVGYISFNIWMVAAAEGIELAIDRHRGDDGLVLDLRGNPGGLGGMAMGIAGHFLDRDDSLGRMTARDGSIEFRINPRRVTSDGRIVEPFAGPLAILIDPLTASTSEIFTAGLQELGRAFVVGQTSAGAALPAIAVSLPNGDVLLYAMADFVTPKGNRIEGHGVVPDLPVTLSRKNLERESDPVLAAALRWIVEQRSALHPPST